MGKRVNIQEAVTITGLSEYALRQGVRQKRFPHIRTSGNNGKILFDIDLLEEHLRWEAESNTLQEVLHYGQLQRVSE